MHGNICVSRAVKCKVVVYLRGRRAPGQDFDLAGLVPLLVDEHPCERPQGGVGEVDKVAAGLQSVDADGQGGPRPGMQGLILDYDADVLGAGVDAYYAPADRIGA